MSATILYFRPMAELPNRLRELRKARGWSLEYVALEVGCSIPQVSDLERGQKPLTLEWMRRLAPVFGVLPGNLLLEADSDGLHDPAEIELIQRFRQADPAQREQMQRMADVIVPYRAGPPKIERAA